MKVYYVLRYVVTVFGTLLFKNIVLRIYEGHKKGHLRAYLKTFSYTAYKSAGRFLENFFEATEDLGELEGARFVKLRRTCLGLHSLLPREERYSYSILMPVYKPKPQYFRRALIAALDQTAPDFELLVGFDGPQPSEVAAVIAALRQERPDAVRLKQFEFDRAATGGGISRVTNALAAQATKHFLVLMDHDDWIRPDLLFRYEQTLRMVASPDNTVMFCDEYKINERDETVDGSRLRKPDRPDFPYLFINWVCHCLMVPRHLWNHVGGLRPECDGSQDYDLSLRLDVAGAEFVNVPVPLYAWRAHAASTAQTVNQKDYATPAGVRALTDYVAAKGLPWKIEAGMRPTTYRAIPQIQGEPEVLAVVPFKEQKELTLQAVRHALDQKGVRVRVVAVDNGSQDLSIAQELTAMGAEVLRIDEPFNFSRLNNLAIARTRYREIQNILFLNNDVILNAGAVLEMVRWVDQPKIGLVGARLNYPNGNLQHGGVILDGMLAHERMPWRHEDKNAPEMALAFAAVIHTADAVTAACAMMKRALFNQVGGFDEIWYPIAFSDTDLAAKLKALGYVSLYTPFAVGIHHESVSRAVGNIEDYEGSRWLYNRLRGPKQA